jgi:hypothetical protein
MAQKREYKLVQGDVQEINRTLTIEMPKGWKPILLSSVLVGMVVTAQVMLERAED